MEVDEEQQVFHVIAPRERVQRFQNQRYERQQDNQCGGNIIEHLVYQCLSVVGCYRLTHTS